jgi:hypothetical protein
MSSGDFDSKTRRQRFENRLGWVAGTVVVTLAVMWPLIDHFIVGPKNDEIERLRREVKPVQSLPETGSPSPGRQSNSPSGAGSKTPDVMVFKSPSPRSSVIARGELGLTLEELQTKYQSLKDRFAEQEALVVNSDLKRVRWNVSVIHVENCGAYVCMTFSSKRGQQLPSWSARFPLELKERIYSLHPGDIIEIDGILKANGGSNYLELEARTFEVIVPAERSS